MHLCSVKISRGREATVIIIQLPPPPPRDTGGHWSTTQIGQHNKLCVSVAQEGEDAPLRSFGLFSWFVHPAHPLGCWIHSSDRTSLLHHLFEHVLTALRLLPSTP